ncbi:MAG TPA: YidB family protein, partial [Pseudolabrys sp.]|nr:YidB family protein [Pseudolabrys sp.]
LANALGSDTIHTLSKHSGLSMDDLLAGLSQHLPDLVDQLTPHGRLPNEQEAARMV